MKEFFFVFFTTLLVYGNSQTFHEITSVPFDGVTNSSVAVSDVDNDNDLDILVNGYNNFNQYVCKLYKNDGGGSYMEVTGTPFEGTLYGDVAFADIDNDNDQDVLITGFNSGFLGTAKMYKNDGAGNFSLINNTPFEGVLFSSIAFADIDNDNDQDLLITGKSSSNIRTAKLYINDGVGNFTLNINTPFEGSAGGAVHFFDSDIDLDMDVIINSGGNGTIKLYKNDGNGNYSLFPGAPIDGTDMGAIGIADIDNDNDQDLLITGARGFLLAETSATLYTNDGNGNYTMVTSTSIEKIRYGDVAIEDVDNDQDPDIIINGRDNDGQEITHLYTNDGTGNFTEVIGTPFTEVASGSISFIDIDNDNDQDVLITGSDSTGQRSSKLYENLNSVGVNEDDIFSKTTVFPSPTKGIINIKLDGLINTSIIVHNANGEQIYHRENIRTSIHQLELNAPSGIYFIEVNAQEKRQTFKLVKE